MSEKTRMIKALDWDKGFVMVRITDKTASTCSVTDTPMQVTVMVYYIPDKKLIEFVSFREYLKEVSKGSYTAEEFATVVLNDVIKAVDPILALVEVKVNTLEHGPVEIATYKVRQDKFEYLAELIKIPSNPKMQM